MGKSINHWNALHPTKKSNLWVKKNLFLAKGESLNEFSKLNSLQFGLKMLVLKKINWFIILCVGIMFTYAQENGSSIEAPKFKSYTIFDGLPSTSVSSIAQDDKGFMWFGTRDGLSRFDGFDFTNFYKDSNDSLSLSHNQIRSTYIDADGNLWVGTKNGLNRYTEGQGFKRYFHTETDFESLSSSEILSITEDNEGHIWVGTDNGINRLNKTGDGFTRYTNDPKNTNSLKNNYAKEIYVDSKDFLWAITAIGIERLNIKTGVFKHYVLGKGEQNLKDVNFASALYEDSKGRFWIGSANGLWYHDQEKDVLVSYTGKDHMLADISVRSIIEDEKGNLLIGAYTGFYVDDVQKGTTSHFQHNSNDSYSINSNSIHAIFRDAVDNLWFGTWAGGINYLGWSFDSFNHYSEVSGLSFPVVSSFVEDKSSNFWIGTEGGGLNYFDRPSGRFTSYRHEADNPNSLSHDNVHDVAMDGAGNLVIATFGSGLDYFNPTAKPIKFEHFRSDARNPTGLGDDFILSLFKDSKDRMWVGTSNAGLHQFHADTKSFTKFTEKNRSLSAVNVIFEDIDGKILVGTSNGLGVVDGLNNTVAYELFDTFNAQIAEIVLCIYRDNNKNYWLATDGEGLIFMDAGLSKIERFGKSEGLPNDVVYGILPDASGNLWLSTHNGISKFDLRNRTFKNFDVHDGLQSNEFNFDAYATSSKGELLFGGVNGFNMLYPDEIEEIVEITPVVITDFKVNEKSVKVAAEDSPLSESLAKTTHIYLDHDQSLFSFEFIALDYARPEKNKYSYLLEGFTDEWLNIGSRRQVTFTNIEPGDYTFKVRVSNSGEIDNEKETIMKITVLPPPWKSWWAYLIYAVLLATVGYIIWRYIRLRIRDRNALKTEKMEREKDEELHELKLQFFTNVSHELRTPLTLIMGPLEKLMQRKDTLESPVQEELTLIDRNAKSLMRHVNNIMEFRKESTGKLKLKAAKGNFVKFSNETFLSFRQLAETRNIDYVFTSKIEAMKAYFDRDKMEIVLYNLLSNAFKFTPDGGKISLTVFPLKKEGGKPKRIGISITDNGSGIDAEHIDHIFERFFQVDDKRLDTKGSGIGLALTKSLVELHYGTIGVTSKKGKETKFTIELPTGKKHLQESEIYKEFKSGEDVANYNERKIETKPVSKAPETPAQQKENLPVLLIIEDNYDVRKFIVSCFNEDYQIKEAPDGGAGYEMAMELIPDLIISDVMMPEMDGITLCSKLKKDVNTSHIPIVLLTARTSLIFKKDGLETGADDYINKPFTPSILKLKVRNLMDTRKKMQEYFVRNYRVNPKEVVMTSKDDEFLDKAIQCVEAHLSDSEFNVSVFINEMAMSRSVLFRKIKGLTGQSTTEFIRTIRIKRAAQILVQNQLSISETAYEVGFNDLKYFRTCFRKQFNSSPSEFIAKHAKENENSFQD